MLRKYADHGVRAMKTALTIGLAIAAAGLSLAAARPLQAEPVTAAAVLPTSDILGIVREMGFAPHAPVRRRGPYYVLHAVDLRGVELRIVADAQFGDILWVTPAYPYYYVPAYVRAPHIIHVPPRGEAKPRKRSEAAPPPKSAAKKPAVQPAPDQAAIAPAKVLSKDE